MIIVREQRRCGECSCTTTLVTTNYVLVEAVALVQNRLGLQAAKGFLAEMAPVMIVRWIDEQTHSSAYTLWLATNRRPVSFVDASSFVVMRELGLLEAFAYDKHFVDQGFTVLG